MSKRTVSQILDTDEKKTATSRYYRHFSHSTVINIMLYFLRALLAVAAAACVGSALADDNEPPLFVAESGADRGDCRDTAAPCRTIGYALQRVGKNGQIRVAGGSYELAAIEDVVYLVSGAIDARGGSGGATAGKKSASSALSHPPRPRKKKRR